jgi:hypothetical protein
MRTTALICALLASGCARHLTGTFAAPQTPYFPARIGYKVYRGTTPQNMQAILTTDKESFTDRQAQPGAIYYYKVTAVYADGSESESTNIVCGSVDRGQLPCVIATGRRDTVADGPILLATRDRSEGTESNAADGSLSAAASGSQKPESRECSAELAAMVKKWEKAGDFAIDHSDRLSGYVDIVDVHYCLNLRDEPVYSK